MIFVGIFKVKCHSQLSHTANKSQSQYYDQEIPVNNGTCFWLANHSSPYAKENFQE